MRTKLSTVYHALCDGAIALPSLTPVTLATVREYYWFDEAKQWSFEEVTTEVPFEEGETRMWMEERPHVHYACRHCGEEHNFDLDLSDENPRLAVCDLREMKHYTLVAWTDKAAS